MTWRCLLCDEHGVAETFGEAAAEAVAHELEWHGN